MVDYEEIRNLFKKLESISKPIIKELRCIDSPEVKSSVNAMKETLTYVSTLQNAEINKAIGTVTELKKLYTIQFTNQSIDVNRIIEYAKTLYKQKDLTEANKQVNYVDIIKNMHELGYSLSAMAKFTYEEDAFEENKDDVVIESFNDDEEIAELLQEQEKNPKRFQERFAEWSEKKKKQYCLIIGIIMFIWLHIFAPYFDENIGKPIAASVISKVRELPNTGASIIDSIAKGVKGLITENAPYYYKIQYEDDNERIKEGYVAKRNLIILEQENEITEIE